MTIHAQDIKILRQDANLLLDLCNRVADMDTPQRREEFKNAQAWFKEKYPHYRWQDWAENIQPATRSRGG